MFINNRYRTGSGHKKKIVAAHPLHGILLQNILQWWKNRSSQNSAICWSSTDRVDRAVCWRSTLNNRQGPNDYKTIIQTWIQNTNFCSDTSMTGVLLRLLANARSSNHELKTMGRCPSGNLGWYNHQVHDVFTECQCPSFPLTIHFYQACNLILWAKEPK